MENQLLEAIRLQNGKITFKNLSKKFDIDTEELKKILLNLKLDAKILQLGNKYMLFPEDLNIGTICVSQTGRKYIFHSGEKISVAANFFSELILNDVVSYKVNDNNEAEIVSIVNRPLGKMTCEIKVIDGKKKIIPFYSGINLTLPTDIMDTLYDGDIIVVETIPNELFDYVDATFIEKLGRRDDPLTKDAAIALNMGFNNIYDDEYMQEIYSYPKEVSEDETLNRYDYRNQTCFTIDGVDTKDMDDGVYGEVIDDNVIRIYVHIADVSHYIKIDSKAFERACDKTTSLYMNNSVFHMFHHIISNGICSLNPNVDRLTKTIVMDIDKDGNIINYDIQKSVINSKKKMSYDDVDKVIMYNNTPDDYKKYEKTLYILYDAAVRLEKRFTQYNGKINFANNELNITYNQDGTIKTIDKPEESMARKIIENLMIAANSCVANWFSNMEIPTVYRVHEFPSITRINAVIEELNKSGFNIKPIRDVDNPKSLQYLLNVLSSYPEFPVISQMLVMAMQRARYSTENVGHYALGLDAYCHFTSPIRRLADLLVHMMTDLVLIDYEKINPETLSEYENMLIELSDRASVMERQADLAERMAERRLILDKLEKHKDEEFEATVVEVGKKIKLRVDGIDTYIDSHELDNVFAFNAKRKIYYDKVTGEHIKIGTKVFVKLMSVSSISDSFSVMVTGIVNTDVKKKILSK